MAARVLYRDAQGRTGEVQLTADQPCYIGRALDCAVRTDDAMVSRKHSLIRMEGGRFLVEDLGSSNGTHVNDIKVSRQTLNHNDVVRCGNLWLRYIDDGPSEQPAAGKFSNTLGGDGPDLPKSGPAVVDPTVAKPMGAPPAAPVAPMSGAGSGGQPATIMAGGDDGQLAGDPTPPAGGIMQTMMSPGAMPQRANGGSQPHARPATDHSPAATYETEPAGVLTRDELERRLNLAVSRGAELERSLLTLQAELQAAQEKIKALLRSVQELTGLKQ